jgi:hypothetical protein
MTLGFVSPTDGTVTYIFLFDVDSDSIVIQLLTSFDFGTSNISQDIIDGYLTAPAKVVPFGGSASQKRHHKRRHNVHV